VSNWKRKYKVTLFYTHVGKAVRWCTEYLGYWQRSSTLVTAWRFFLSFGEIQWSSQNFQELHNEETWWGCRAYFYVWKKVNQKDAFLCNCKSDKRNLWLD